MRRIFNKFRGSKAFAARELNVQRVTITRYLAGDIVSARLGAALPIIAERLEATNGACIDDVNGKSLRSQLGRLRRKRGPK